MLPYTYTVLIWKRVWIIYLVIVIPGTSTLISYTYSRPDYFDWNSPLSLLWPLPPLIARDVPPCLTITQVYELCLVILNYLTTKKLGTFPWLPLRGSPTPCKGDHELYLPLTYLLTLTCSHFWTRSKSRGTITQRETTIITDTVTSPFSATNCSNYILEGGTIIAAVRSYLGSSPWTVSVATWSGAMVSFLVQR